MLKKMAGKTFKMGMIQLQVGSNKAANIERASKMVKEAADNGAQIIALPECWNSPYGTQFFGDYSELIGKDGVQGESTQALSKMAKENNIYLIGGSIPEKVEEDGKRKLYNTSVVYDNTGKAIAQHRKIHLFDIDVPGQITFKESDVLSPGNSLTTFDTPYAKFGLGICYDIRFSDLSTCYANEGCDILCFPGAFNMTTGPAHWEHLQRARAVDNQLYVCAISPARTDNTVQSPSNYVAWGHSTMINPWGDVVATTDHAESIVYADVNLEKIKEVRRNIPVRNQKRFDLYNGPSKI